MPSDTKWITVNGSHIPVEGGETKRQAVNKLHKLVEDERITSKNLGGNSLFWYPDSKGRLPNVNSIKRWATNYPDINVRKAAKEFQTKFGNVPLKKTMLQGQETALPEKNKWGYINAHNKVNTAYYTSPMFINKINGGVRGLNKPVEEVPNRPRAMNITVNANGNEKIQQANKKLERYFLGSFAVGMLNGEKTILPKNKLRREGFIKAFRKLNKEIDKTQGASMKVTVHDSMDAFYAGVHKAFDDFRYDNLSLGISRGMGLKAAEDYWLYDYADKKGNLPGVKELRLFAEKGHPDKKVSRLAQQFQKDFGKTKIDDWKFGGFYGNSTLLPKDGRLHSQYENEIKQFLAAWKKTGYQNPHSKRIDKRITEAQRGREFTDLVYRKVKKGEI